MRAGVNLLAPPRLQADVGHASCCTTHNRQPNHAPAPACLLREGRELTFTTTDERTLLASGRQRSAPASACLRREGREPMLRLPSSPSGVAVLKYCRNSGVLNTTCLHCGGRRHHSRSVCYDCTDTGLGVGWLQAEAQGLCTNVARRALAKRRAPAGRQLADTARDWPASQAENAAQHCKERACL